MSGASVVSGRSAGEPRASAHARDGVVAAWSLRTGTAVRRKAICATCGKIGKKERLAAYPIEPSRKKHAHQILQDLTPLTGHADASALVPDLGSPHPPRAIGERRR
jgi:hypothetical protein